MLRIGIGDFEALSAHGEAAYPQECCGVLLGIAEGETRRVAAVVKAANARTDSPANRYGIAPEELVRIQREARERELDIVGFYHSHPDCAAQWSATDLAEAHWLGCSYVITSVVDGQAVETRAFALTGMDEATKRFEDEGVEVADK